MADQTEDRIYKLATELLTRTKANKVQWTEQTPSKFYTQFGDHFAVIRSVDGDGHHPYRFAIEDDRDKDLGGISTTDDFAFDAEWRETLAQLYGEAKRRGGAIEKALDDIFADLKNDDIPF
jgi:hypothetical protein